MVGDSIKTAQEIIQLYTLQRRTSELVYLPPDFNQQLRSLYLSLQTKDPPKADTVAAFVRDMFKIRSRIMLSRILLATSTIERGDQIVVAIPNCTSREKELCQQLLSTINKYWSNGTSVYLEPSEKILLIGGKEVIKELPDFPPLPENALAGVFEEKLKEHQKIV